MISGGPARRPLIPQIRLVARQLLRNRRRALLTSVGLAISFFLYTSLESMLFTLERLVDEEASETGIFMRPRGRGSFFSPELPIRYVDQILEIEGVLDASPVRFYFARGRREGTFAVALGVDADAFLRLRSLDGVTPEEARAFQADRLGALAGRRVLESNEWRVGEEATLRGAGPMPALTVRVLGDIADDDRMSRVVIVHIDYLEDVLGGEGRAAFIQARVAHPSLAPAIVRAIDERFANFTVPTRTETERAHVAGMISSLSDVLVALRSIGYITLAITVLVVGNSVAMSVRERTVEIGTLRALGFGRSRVMALVLFESVLLSLVGGVTGALIAYTAFETGWIRLPRSVGMPLTSDETVLLRAALLALPVGLLAGIQPAWSAVRMSITSALRFSD